MSGDRWSDIFKVPGEQNQKLSIYNTTSSKNFFQKRQETFSDIQMQSKITADYHYKLSFNNDKIKTFPNKS